METQRLSTTSTAYRTGRKGALFRNLEQDIEQDTPPVCALGRRRQLTRVVTDSLNSPGTKTISGAGEPSLAHHDRPRDNPSCGQPRR